MMQSKMCLFPIQKKRNNAVTQCSGSDVRTSVRVLSCEVSECCGVTIVSVVKKK